MRPAFRSVITLSTASRISGEDTALIWVRASHARSMVFCSSWVMRSSEGFSGVGHDAARSFQAFVDAGHEREADAARSRVDAVRLARQQAAGKHGDIVLSEQ